ncbi:Uracil phosphoribosyltransferase [Mesoplasma sp. JKS002658]|uniref:uracil phosphoribosyltransferase n=1 Tax=Mesoplasma whartonense TaxID=2878854 RepID=UPI002022A20D|nr:MULTISPECIES: uracil phosphoribosyltransferase [unclassified Mesoplasma]MCL8211731.1 Uracil phosphoribosyltransferase [Mesoplasma sp. JKS002664]MCL8212108.1 Uracil phosphoribosyltransferase [Mesoplasma sp. JKS002662]MCL8213655.1 Uracil phosphoribosyltransferase [Mesoplasma sp. JKS002660]MCL8213787.1 Uracil phosphoribosyltransferase [Mesoplasma sp. JKS002658]MCL8215067.1 Uracil phosphoribosyltransferase [Mesoplasma sp. JKS002663]
MSVFELKHPLIIDKLTRMRRKETTSKDFRENLNEIAGLMVYEVFRDLPLSEQTIQTPLVETTGYVIKTPVVLVPIIRAGLGMVEGIQQLVPTSRVAHIGLYRDEVTKQPVQYYAKPTPDVNRSYVLVVDPMLATGGSANKALMIAKEWGAKTIKFICLVAAPQGIESLQTAHPDVDIYVASIDQSLNDEGYIIPGLGDAGDRIFGTK